MPNIHHCFAVLFCVLLVACDGDSNNHAFTKQTNINNVTDCQNQAKPFNANMFSQPGIHLFVFGDSGTGNNNQKLVAKIIDDYHSQYPLDAIIHSGDVFYPAGISSKNDSDTNQKFIDIYSPLAIGNLNWYLVAGNHDYNGSINALLDFAQSQPFIHYNDRYYQQKITATSKNFHINLIATDTTPFTKGLPQIEQLAWLNKQLLLSDGINLVLGHHPILSNGSHGDTEILTANFYQLLQFYQVPLYLSGHEHSLEYLAPNAWPHMIISGAGGQNLRNINCSKQSLYANKAFGGFALFITKANIWIIPVTEQGFDRAFALELTSIENH